jgi:hypothetical protein
MPESVSTPVPVLTSAAPVPPPAPPSAMTPVTLVDRPLPPMVSVLEPSRKLPAPSNEPAVVPADVRDEKSNTPPALAISRALPPLAVL